MTGRLRTRPATAGALLLLLIVALTGPLAHAHGLRVSVQAEIDALRGQAFYADGTPAAGSRVEIYDLADGDVPAAAGITDADGRFYLAAALGRSYRVVVDGDEGHRAEAVAMLAPAAAGMELSAALRAEIAPLREDVARLQQRIRMSDVIGGIGFIVGLFGGIAWLMARRRS